MKKLFFSLTPRNLLPFALTLMGGLGLCSSALAQDIQRSIETANWQESVAAYRATPLQQSTPVLRALSQNNNVMAQWFLADALALQGQHVEATYWLYSASLGTRMDSTLCLQDNANTLEGRFVKQFSRQFDVLRANDRWRRQGLERAVEFHRQRLQGSKSPTWVCQLLQHERPTALRYPWHDTPYWLNLREQAFKSYQSQTGLDFSRTPDLYQMTRN